VSAKESMAALLDGVPAAMGRGVRIPSSGEYGTRPPPRLTVALTHSGSNMRLLDSESGDRLHQAWSSGVYVCAR
jgi:hypothetical protein